MRLPRYTYRIRKILYAPVTVIVLVIALGVLVRATIGAYSNERQNYAAFEAARHESSDLSDREAFLSNEMVRLESPRGMEEELRNQFPVVKDGEQVVIIVEPEAGNGTTSRAAPGGFWDWLQNLFR